MYSLASQCFKSNFFKCIIKFSRATKILIPEKKGGYIKNNHEQIKSIAFYNATTFNTKFRTNGFSLTSSSLSSILFSKRFSTSSTKDNEDDVDDQSYQELVRRTFRLPDEGHQVYLIQPYIKWGRFKKTITTPELQLNEAVALVNTLPQWKVIASKIIPLMNFDSVKIFGKGNLELLAERVKTDKTITAVFISINLLTPRQQKFLEDTFKVPVFDRYNIVVQIFKLHATTKEAKIQVAMGEIPYLWSRLKHDNNSMSDKMGGGATVGGPGESYFEIKKRLLQDKERKLKNELKKLESQREILRSKRQKLEIPTVAIVGYTNAGKTSLIKALTLEERLQPRDVLFATLDVTVHGGFLPSGLKVLFIDTVGFLTDIPTNLIQSFVATLEDAVRADLLIHVQDISHPDWKAQHEHVLTTLQSINMPENLLKNIITVANKVDLVSDSFSDMESNLPVSALTGFGLDALKVKIENEIIKATGQIFIKIRVPNGGPELSWLHKEATIVKVLADEANNQFVFVNTIITEANLNKFKHIFIKSKRKT